MPPTEIPGVGSFAANDPGVGAFGEQLEERVLTAYFVAGAVYIAAAVGMQTVTLVIRGLSLGVAIGSLAVREVVTRGPLGLILASLTFPLIWVGWGDIEVAAAVAVARFAASSTRDLCRNAPALDTPPPRQRPRHGSGPIATVVQDLMTVSIYFLTAVATTH